MAATSPALPELFWQLVDSAQPAELGALDSYLTPTTCHSLLANRSSVAALVDSFTTCVGRLVDCSDGRDTGNPERGYWHNRAHKRWIAIDRATKSCLCGDDVIFDGLAVVLRDIYSPNSLRDVPELDQYVTLFETLVDRVAERPTSGRRGNVAVARRTAFCAALDDDASRRARLTRLATAPLVLTMAADRLSHTIDRRVNNLYDARELVPSLAVFATVCPRKLLSAVPDVTAQVVRHMGSLLNHGSSEAGNTLPLLSLLLITLKELVTVDATQFRRIPAAPRLLAKLARLMGENVELVDPILSLLCVYGVVWQGLARSPSTDVASLLVRYATAPLAGAPPDFAARAANLALHVAMGADASASHTVPAALLDAKPQWRRSSRVAVGTPLGTIFQALYRLGSSTSRSAGGAVRPTPWAPAPCPPSCVQFLASIAGRCWGCGNDHAADAPDRPVKRCSKCSVALYCSAACSSASWAEHKRACPGWARLGDQAVQAEKSRQAAGSSLSPAPVPTPRLRARRVVYNATQENFSGNWKTDWTWPAAKARQVEDAGLLLRDVVCLVERESGAVVIAPAEAYSHWPGAVPRDMLDAPLAKNNGRMLRVIHRVHPPHVMSFGPKSLGLAPRPAEADLPVPVSSRGGAATHSRSAAPARSSVPRILASARTNGADDSDSDDSMVAAFNAAASISGRATQPLDPSIAAEVRAWRMAGTLTVVPQAPIPVVSLQSVRVVRPPEDPTDPPTLKVRLLVRAYGHMNRTMSGGGSSGSGGCSRGGGRSSTKRSGGSGSRGGSGSGGGSGNGLAGFPSGSAGVLQQLLQECNPRLLCEDAVEALGRGAARMRS